ncbi:MAG TPA: preprotein translocase subunit SecY [Ktedonobacterales bacterium]
MWERLRSIWTIPDLRNKILFTISMLLVFRLMAHVPVPGVDSATLQSALSKNSGLNQVFGLLDLFSGGSFQSTFSVVAMGVYPYITASIVVQLLQPIIPRMAALSREGESGRNRLSQITRYLAVPLALLQAFGQIAILVKANAISQTSFGLFNAQTLIPSLAILISLTAGTMFLVWLGELITENGIGNGISLIIFAGIVSRLPQSVGSQLVSSSSTSGGSSNASVITIVVLGALALALIYAMVYVYQAQRRVPVQYPTKRRIMQGVRSGSQTTYIPLQVNSAGMIPLIFASSILLLPTVVASYLTYSTNKGLSQLFTNVRVFLDSSNWWYWAIYGGMVFAFTMFYATVVWDQQNLPENLQKQGAFIPGIRPGEPTRRHLVWILYRITFGGALFLGVISIAPAIVNQGGASTSRAGLAASLLIVVGVVLDTVKQLEAQMVMRNYSGFLR